jgi:hypothetical protein
MKLRAKTALLISLAATAGCPPGPYEEVGVHFNRLLRNPNQACTWVSAHAQVYDGAFSSCATRKLHDLTNYINAQIDYCDNVFGDPDFRRACYSDHNVPALEFRESALASVIEITVHGNNCALVGCSCLTFGSVYQPVADFFDQNARDLGLSITWEQTLDESLQRDKEDLTCD